MCVKNRILNSIQCLQHLYITLPQGCCQGPNVSKICTFRAKMASEVILINTNVGWFLFLKKKNSNKKQTSNSSSKMLFYLFSYAIAELCCFLLQGSLFFIEIERKPLFSVSFSFPLSLPSPCKHISPCLAISVSSLNPKFLFISLCSTFIF